MFYSRPEAEVRTYYIELLSAGVYIDLLSTGGQDGKIPPAHETNQITGFFLSCPLARPKKKK